ncbi:MAG TPA: sulfotransferase family 2 domain-containing protein [Rhizomicrobium sp.]|nr:sulfotransferase family 2 domain-containing protein [Rhizomicrobium sp.]
MITARQAFEMNYNIHISEEFGFIFFNNPKAGCSTTKATLNLACAKRLGVDLEYGEMHDIHARERNILKTPKQIGAKRFEAMVADPKIVRFCVLREPVSRTASAYASKFRGNSPQQQRLNAFLNKPEGYRWPDINEFVAALASNVEVRDFDPHWRLQYRQVCAADVDLTLIGFQEELDVSLRKFARLVFGDAEIDIFDVRSHFKHNVSKSRVLMQSLTPASLALLKRTYAEDFEFYAREWARAHPDA